MLIPIHARRNRNSVCLLLRPALATTLLAEATLCRRSRSSAVARRLLFGMLQAMDSQTPAALCAPFASEDTGIDALREFSEAIEQDLRAIIENSVRFLEQGSGDVDTVVGAGASMERGLMEWIHSFERPRDRDYFESRRELGRHQSSIGLSRELLIAAFGRFRAQLSASAISWSHLPDHRLGLLMAINRELDLDLALVLQGHIEFEQRKLATEERPADGAQVSASVAHALRNPLATIETSAYLIGQRLIGLGISDPGIERHLDKIRRHVQLCSGILGDLLGKKS